MPLFKILLVSTVIFSTISNSKACSMYKITVGDKTMVGTNEDAWRTDSYIWFETGKEGEYGACYTGSRSVGGNSYAAQSGMNEQGLVYSRLESYHPSRPEKVGINRKTIKWPDDFLKQILHKCKDVNDVYDYMKQYDHSIFIHDVFIFVDKSGKHLIVEPYSMQIGNEANYVLSNFCPSITSEDQRRNLKRYRNGVDLLSTGADTSLDFCKSLSNAMHVCRENIGDGTLLTGIWDIKNREVNIYFYHDYSKVVSFNINDELSKGNHSIDVTTLFPVNTEFERLKTYITPLNNPALRLVMALLGMFFFVSSLLFAVNAVRKKLRHNRLFKGLFSLLCFMMFCYMYVLTTNMDAFYFAAPYVHYQSNLISAFSYAPIIMLAALVPSIKLNYKIIKENSWGIFWRFLLTANNIAYIILFGSFIYWGFYYIF